MICLLINEKRERKRIYTYLITSISLQSRYLFTGIKIWYTSASRLFGKLRKCNNNNNNNRGTFPCGNCGRIYRHSGNMRRHMVYECGKQARFQCTECFRKFHQLSNLKRHCDSQHKDMIDKNYYGPAFRVKS